MAVKEETPEVGAQNQVQSGSVRSWTFDYVTLRLLVGIIAFAMPVLVTALAGEPLESISASYHTAAQDAFVGQLFVVASFMVAYRGRTRAQGVASSLGGVAAAMVALYPTSTVDMPDLPSSPVHYAAAAALFVVLAFFCFVFWKDTHDSDERMERRRSPIYAVSGITMLVCILVIGVGRMFPEVADELRLTFWVEWIALWAFGIAWIVAGKSLPYLSEQREQPQLLRDIRACLPFSGSDGAGEATSADPGSVPEQYPSEGH